MGIAVDADLRRQTFRLVDEDELPVRRLNATLHHPDDGQHLREDLSEGLSTLPAWMQNMLTDAERGSRG